MPSSSAKDSAAQAQVKNEQKVSKSGQSGADVNLSSSAPNTFWLADPFQYSFYWFSPAKMGGPMFDYVSKPSSGYHGNPADLAALEKSIQLNPYYQGSPYLADMEVNFQLGMWGEHCALCYARSRQDRQNYQCEAQKYLKKARDALIRYKEEQESKAYAWQGCEERNVLRALAGLDACTNQPPELVRSLFEMQLAFPHAKPFDDPAKECLGLGILYDYYGNSAQAASWMRRALAYDDLPVSEEVRKTILSRVETLERFCK